MPVIKDSVIILDDGLARDKPSIHDILPIVEESLSKAGVSYDRILVKGAELMIEDGKPSKRMLVEPRIFRCPHCGFMTTSEEEYWNHLKCHYVGF